MASAIGDLIVRFGANTSGFQRGAGLVQGALGRLKASAAGLSGAFGLGGIFSGVGLVYMAKRAVDAATVQEQAEKKLAAVVRSTGGAAGFTAGELAKYAAELQKVTNYGDEATISAMAVLATFTRIRGGVFKEAIVAAQNMSAVLGQDLQSSVIQLGKALNDPIKGVTALRRVGVSFTQAQMAQIKTLVESNDLLGAQRIILAELKTEFGGAAQAMADPLTQAKNRISDLNEELGKAVKPGFISFVEVATPALEWLIKLIEKTIFIVRFAIGGLRTLILDQLALWGNMIATITGSQAMEDWAKGMYDAARRSQKELTELWKTGGKLPEVASGAKTVSNAFDDVANSENAAKDALKNFQSALRDMESRRQRNIETTTNAMKDVLFFGRPTWERTASDMLLGGEDPRMVQRFVGWSKELDKLKKNAETMKLGEKMIGDTMTPLEKLRKQFEDIERLRRVGALGENATTVSFRAKMAAIKEYEDAVKQKPVEYKLAGAARWDSKESASLIAKNWAMVQGAKQRQPDAQTAKNTAEIKKSIDALKKRIEQSLTAIDNADTLGIPS